MKQENSDQESKNFKNINDDQERIFFQLSSIWDKKPMDSQKILLQLHELRLLQTILYSLITSGILAFFILILISIHLIIIIIDIGVVVLYIVYLKYLKYILRKSLKITRKDLKLFIKLRNKSKELSNLQIIFYSTLIFITIAILIISMIDIDPLILIIIIGISLIYIYFDKDLKDHNTSNI